MMLQKQLFTLIISLVSLHLFSQNNNGTLYALDLTIDGETTRYIEEDCSFRYWPAFSPGNAYEPFCGEMIWAFSDNGDSLLCDPSSAHNLGKIVLVRRGNCVFFSKIQHAMNTGAKAVIILNHFTNQNETECSLSMPGLETVPSIHSFFMSRQLGTIITNALAEGKTVQACFNPTSFSRPFAEYSYAIPVSHVGPMDQISVNFHNATGTTQEFQFKATIEEPGGNIVELDTFATVESYANSGFSQKIQFPTYYAPAEIGEFNVTFSSSHPEVTSTISRKFIHTEHTFAADNLQPTTYVCTHNLTQQTGPCKWSVVYHTGPAGERPTYATVGIENGDLVAGTSLSILLYDGDPDNDGVLSDTIPSEFIAFADIFFSANQPASALLSEPLVYLIGDQEPLKPNHFYKLDLIHWGIPQEVPSICLTATNKVRYNYTLQEMNGAGCSGMTWHPEYNFISRLGTGDIPVSVSESDTQPSVSFTYTVLPNPSAGLFSIDYDAARPAKVQFMVYNTSGQLVYSTTRSNLQKGLVELPLTKLPAGQYFLSIEMEHGGRAGSVLSKL